ncbi:MAG: phospholipase D-like domain-containing protein, partial [Rubripirellula sp.]|nr:phospholipase D-like domain-containing protein [Rubripirellula sp.]
FMHQKCILVDNSLALIGSTNLDQRSLHLNFELMVATEDPQIIDGVSAMIQDDLNLSVEDHPARWWLTNIGTAFARLFSPIL